MKKPLRCACGARAAYAVLTRNGVRVGHVINVGASVGWTIHPTTHAARCPSCRA